MASFTSKLHHFHQANAIQNRQHAITHKDIFSLGRTATTSTTSTAPLQSSLTVDDWHSASQLHPLDNLGGVDESSSSFMMAGTQYSYDGTTYGRSDGTTISTASHHSITVSGDNDETREIMEAFFPVLLLIVLEIYSQKMLHFPMA